MLKHIRDIKLFPLYILTQFLVAILAFINDYIVQNTSQSGAEEFDSLSRKIVLALAIAPLFETIIFNLLLNELFYKFIKKEKIVIIISSLCFGLIHYYSWTYVAFTFLAGIFFNNYYFKVREKKGYLFAAFLVFLMHFIHNGIGLLLGK